MSNGASYGDIANSGAKFRDVAPEEIDKLNTYAHDAGRSAASRCLAMSILHINAKGRLCNDLIDSKDDRMRAQAVLGFQGETPEDNAVMGLTVFQRDGNQHVRLLAAHKIGPARDPMRAKTIVDLWIREPSGLLADALIGGQIVWESPTSGVDTVTIPSAVQERISHYLKAPDGASRLLGLQRLRGSLIDHSGDGVRFDMGVIEKALLELENDPDERTATESKSLLTLLNRR